MRRTRKETEIEKLSKEIFDHEIRIGKRIRIESGTNEHESMFVGRLATKHPNVQHLRHGWPDFLCEDMQSGKIFAVEVKHGQDRMSERQSAMSELLERAGIPVYVWRPKFPHRLVPFKKAKTRSEYRYVSKKDCAK